MLIFDFFLSLLQIKANIKTVTKPNNKYKIFTNTPTFPNIYKIKPTILADKKLTKTAP